MVQLAVTFCAGGGLVVVVDVDVTVLVLVLVDVVVVLGTVVSITRV